LGVSSASRGPGYSGVPSWLRHDHALHALTILHAMPLSNFWNSRVRERARERLSERARKRESEKARERLGGSIRVLNKTIIEK